MNDKELVWQKLKEPAVRLSLLEMCMQERTRVLKMNLNCEEAVLFLSQAQYYGEYLELKNTALHTEEVYHTCTRQTSMRIMGVQVYWVP